MSDGYSAIFIDLADSENQRFSRGHSGSTKYPNDNVKGYSSWQMQKASRSIEGSWSMLETTYEITTAMAQKEVWVSCLIFTLKYNNHHHAKEKF